MPCATDFPPDFQKTRIQVWLFENTDLRIEGKIIVRALSVRRSTTCHCQHCWITMHHPGPGPGRGPVVPCAHARVARHACCVLSTCGLPFCLSRCLAVVCLAPQGFDEYMNLVLDDAEELSIKKKTRKALGRILLKGDNITLMMSTGS